MARDTKKIEAVNNSSPELESLKWLRFPIPVHDPDRLRRVVSRQIAFPASNFDLAWDGESLSPVYWERRTPAVKELARTISKGSGSVSVFRVSYSEALEQVSGRSFADCLSEAAKYFGMSYATLHRIVRPGPTRRGNGRKVSIDGSTLFKLRSRPFGKAHDGYRIELDQSVLGPRVGRLIREYLAYIDREIGRHTAKLSKKHAIALKSKARNKFWQRAARAGVPATRAQLADFRTYEVIVVWRRLRLELTSADRTRIVRAGYSREERLMRVEMRALRRGIKDASRARI